MRLRNPGTVEYAIQAIRALQDDLGDCRARHDEQARRYAFLAWCQDQARPKLESLFDPGEELLAELESAYHRLVFARPITQRQLSGRLKRQYSTWEQRLEQVEDELRAQQKLVSSPGHPIVLDTSVFMECEPFRAFCWHALSPALASGPIRLLVPILVLDELDGLMQGRKAERREKARAARGELRHLYGATPTEPAPLPGQADVTIEVLLGGDWHQARSSNVAEIIDQALRVRELTGKATLLASRDHRRLRRAAAAGLPAVLMPHDNQAETKPAAGQALET
jgi:PIN domain